MVWCVAALMVVVPLFRLAVVDSNYVRWRQTGSPRTIRRINSIILATSSCTLWLLPRCNRRTVFSIFFR